MGKCSTTTTKVRMEGKMWKRWRGASSESIFFLSLFCLFQCNFFFFWGGGGKARVASEWPPLLLFMIFVTGHFECFNLAWLLNTQLKSVTNSLLWFRIWTRRLEDPAEEVRGRAVISLVCKLIIFSNNISVLIILIYSFISDLFRFFLFV